jgi:hypothetical protein
MSKYGFMPGTHMEHNENPPVRSKFDKSRGKGLPAPHIGHPGATAPLTGTTIPGHNENGHKLPTERGNSHGGIKTHHHEPGRLGSNMAEGQRHVYGMPNKDQTDRVSAGKVVAPLASMHLHEPDPVRAGGDLHKGQHNTAAGNRYEGGGKSPKSSSPQHQDNQSRRSKEPNAKLDKAKMKGRS